MSQYLIRGALDRPSMPSKATPSPRSSVVRSLLSQISGKTIFVYDKPYLTRYYLIGNGSGKTFEVYLHYMHKVDEFRWLHNHPWNWFLSLVIYGSYWQETFNSKTRRHSRQHIRLFNLFRKTSQYHAIRELPTGSAWTVVVTPPKRRNYEWGYWDPASECHIDDATVGHESASTVTFGRKTLLD
ncbi:MAG: hypothetical protein OXG08_07060 [Gammaproteobacteria bacterium]|nr:hypothetical protein [Gammaproteobacteria bacterium]